MSPKDLAQKLFLTKSEVFDRQPSNLRRLSVFDAYGPPLTDDLIESAERHFGTRLPESYIAILRETNGGFLRERDQNLNGVEFDLDSIMGIGGKQGIDTELGSKYLAAEWDYPAGMITIGGDGHTAVLLDLNQADSDGETPVVFYDTETEPPQMTYLAPTFEQFALSLVKSWEEA